MAANSPPSWRALITLIVFSGLLASSGCATHAKRIAEPRRDFYRGNLTSARKQLSKLSEKHHKDTSVLELDLAMLDLVEGRPQEAEQRLRQTRDEWDRMEQASLAEAAMSAVRDDQSRAYAGEDYEKVLLRVFLTLSSLMGDGIDAESYSLQTLKKHQEILERAQKSERSSRNEKRDSNAGDEQFDEGRFAPHYCIPAIAPYLRGVLREATYSNYDDALRSYRQALELQPTAEFLLGDIQRVTTGTHSAPGHGVLYVFAMVGRGPTKIEVDAPVTTNALLLADQILSQFSEYSLPPTLAPVKVPGVQSPPKPFDLIGIQTGSLATTTLPITDLHVLAENAVQANMSKTIARAVVRRLLKKGAMVGAKDRLAADSDIASLALDIAGVAWEATESADTRCWGVLPREIQVARIELPEGIHEISLEPITAGRPVGPLQTQAVQISSGKNHYLLGYWPGATPIGGLQLSH